MIPVKDETRTITGSLGGEQYAMGIDSANIPHLMGVLTDLYSDNELAALREYSTNARDSHIMAGVDRPILVSLPTPLRETLEIQDFGLGLSVDEVVKVYGSYGASTKRDRNDANGCLGLGSKAALTYTNMFTVRSIKDGVQAEIAFFRKEDGSGTIEVVDTKGTDESNGVTIVIPTKGNNDFKAKALAFYSVWEPGTVEIEGEDIPFILNNEKAFRVNGNLIVPDDLGRGGRGSYIVMGNVTYKNDNANHDFYDNYRVYHFADMGAVDFVPSREALNYTPRTEEYANKVAEESNHEAVRAYVQSEVDKAKDLDEAYAIQQRFANLSRYGADYEWDGIILSTITSMPNRTKRWEPAELNPKDAYKSIRQIRYEYAHMYAFCGNRPGSFSFKAKEQMRKLIAAKYPDVKWVIFTPVPVDTFLKFKAVDIDWNEVTAIDIPRRKRGTGTSYVAPTQYPTWHSLTAGDSVYERYETLPAGKTIIRASYAPDRSQRNWLKVHADHVWVKVTDRRFDKFTRENPVTTTWGKIKEAEWAALPEITNIEKYAHYIKRYNDRDYAWLVKEDLLDDTLKKVAAVDHDALAIKINLWDNVGKTFENIDYINSTYPLLDTYYHAEHSRLYVEAVRQAK